MVRLPFLVFVLAAPVPVTGAEPVARVTTDSPDYCRELVQRLAPLPGADKEPARSLAEDGMRLCESGHPRSGVARLRRAIRAARLEE
ncbi:hypothetical protein [Roseomonas fluvialis]|uniref:Secreted protein n=1 Tax=Roseomonas fluvialis TaxID=1750527 RepID=A0ABM7XY32_9PROT|nr:hypothetical protein [Roseomonas fluvialis]BDG70412.1 hypothetical protein Rmf_03410 [Roseomonas fluvialis]